MKKIKGCFIRNNIIYVRGTVDGEKVRYSTGKKANGINLSWIEKNQRDVLLKLHYQKAKNLPRKTNNFKEFARLSFELGKFTRKDSTNSEYLSTYKNYIEKDFQKYSIEDIKKADLLKWQNKLLETKGIKTKKYLSKGTIKFIRAVFSTILSDAVENDLIEKNPFSTLKTPRNSRKVDKEEEDILPFSLEEINKIIDTAQGQYKNIFTVLFFSGIRTGECWALKWSDINFHNDTIHIQRAIRHGKEDTTKTNKSRYIDILPPVKKALQRQKLFTIAQNSYVFLNQRRKPYQNGQSISDGYWERTLRFCGIDYRVLYQTRHSFASLMISKGEDIV